MFGDFDFVLPELSLCLAQDCERAHVVCSEGMVLILGDNVRIHHG